MKLQIELFVLHKMLDNIRPVQKDRTCFGYLINNIYSENAKEILAVLGEEHMQSCKRQIFLSLKWHHYSGASN